MNSMMKTDTVNQFGMKSILLEKNKRNQVFPCVIGRRALEAQTRILKGGMQQLDFQQDS